MTTYRSSLGKGFYKKLAMEGYSEWLWGKVEVRNADAAKDHPEQHEDQDQNDTDPDHRGERLRERQEGDKVPEQASDHAKDDDGQERVDHDVSF